MKIENHKISSRQLGRMIFYDFFAVSTLVLPGMLAEEIGMDGFFALAAGCIVGYGMLLLVLAQIRNMRQKGLDYDVYLRGHFGTFLAVVILWGYLLTALFGAAYGLRLLCDITRQYLIRDTPAWLVLAVLAVLAVYGLCAGLESRGRMYEIVFWLVLLPLFFLFFLAAHNVEADRWVPVFQSEVLQVLKSSYLVFAFFMSCAFLPMLAEDVSEHADVARVVKQSFVFGMCVNLALFLILTGIFGAPTVATMEEAALTLTAMVKVPGGFLERQDALLCGIWLVSIFAFVENALYYAVWCMKKMSRKQEKGWLLPGTGIVVYALALCMYRSENFASWLSRIYTSIAVPVLVGIVLVLWILSAWKSRKAPVRRNVTLLRWKNRESSERKRMQKSRKKSACREEKR